MLVERVSSELSKRKRPTGMKESVSQNLDSRFKGSSIWSGCAMHFSIGTVCEKNSSSTFFPFQLLGEHCQCEDCRNDVHANSFCKCPKWHHILYNMLFRQRSHVSSNYKISFKRQTHKHTCEHTHTCIYIYTHIYTVNTYIETYTYNIHECIHICICIDIWINN